MAQGYINPQLLAVLAAQGVQLPNTPQNAPGPDAPAPMPGPPQGGLPQPDPLAPLPDAPPPPAPPPPLPMMDSTNDGINSVGRPSDQEDPAAGAAEKAVSRDKALRKLMRQSKGDALMALGASLLSSRTFGEGMSKGIAAYVQTMNSAHRKYDHNTHEDSANGAFDKITDPVTGEVTYQRTPVADYEQEKAKIVADGRLSLANVNNEAKRDVATITTTGAMDRTRYSWDTRGRIADADRTSREHVAEMNNASDETVARIGATARAQNRAPNKLELAAAERARMAPQEIELYGRVESLLDGGSSGAGAGIWNKTKRAIVDATGQDFGDVKLQDMQLLNQHLRALELKAAQALQGQGQVSDAERRILQESTPSMATDPTAMRAVIKVLKDVSYRNLAGAGAPQSQAPSSTPSKDELKAKYGLK